MNFQTYIVFLLGSFPNHANHNRLDWLFNSLFQESKIVRPRLALVLFSVDGTPYMEAMEHNIRNKTSL